MRIAWSGVHQRRKALNILFYALNNVTCPDWSLDVLGHGPCTMEWKKLCHKLGFDEKVCWHGNLDRCEAVRIMEGADVFVITSIHDLTSTVLLEALALGKPVVCLDCCGFSDVVNSSCGIKVKILNAKSVVSEFAKALDLLQNKAFRKQLSEGAVMRARDYTWPKKREVLKAIYRPEWKKILINCYACSPFHGSEPGLGWDYVQEIARDHEIWVLVEKDKWETEITKYLKTHQNELQSAHFIYIHKVRGRFLRKIWPPSYYWFYRLWQKKAYKKALELDAEIHFDAVHQLNMTGFREPGYLWRMTTPFVWGPVGGLGYTDVRLLKLVGIVGACEFLARNILNWLHGHFMLRTRWAARRAAESHALIAATSENQHEMQRLWNVKSVVLSEIGVKSVKEVCH